MDASTLAPSRPRARRAAAIRDSAHAIHARVLVIASRFPPATGPGPTRMAKTVRYLRDYGWASLVVTRGADAAPAETLEDTPVYRIDVPDLDSELQILSPWVNAAGAVTSPLGRGAGWWYGGLRWRAERWRDRLSLPDPGIWRLGHCVRAIQELRAAHPFDAVLSSGMPFSDHMIAWAVAKRMNLPWIAEFRDPWYEYAHAPQWASGLSRRAVAWMERTVVERSTGVVSVSDGMTRRFRERYSRVEADKFFTVENGYDPHDFATADAQADSAAIELFDEGCFTLLHAGSFYGNRTPAALLGGFKRFIDVDPVRRGRTKLILAGRLGDSTEIVARAAQSLPVIDAGAWSHPTALACMRRATANVLVMADGAGAAGDVSAKVFEYLGANRPILALAPENGAAAGVLNRFSGVHLVPPADEAAIARAIQTLYDAWDDNKLFVMRAQSDLGLITRQYQTGRLAGVLDAAVRGNPAPGIPPRRGATAST
jgi:glycosyltransferase involved in cell wall biosynthesis